MSNVLEDYDRKYQVPGHVVRVGDPAPPTEVGQIVRPVGYGGEVTQGTIDGRVIRFNRNGYPVIEAYRQGGETYTPTDRLGCFKAWDTERATWERVPAELVSVRRERVKLHTSEVKRLKQELETASDELTAAKRWLREAEDTAAMNGRLGDS